ncbi:hypothetical protein QAD02_001180 [Eretmocerus hayati]|uniref:Uncharacterized protein n=1 Tax=Eretmocerus hayati TaxID=131215 RepID=A0ACC2NFR2_9HYME|nr:hypothetical protein QAD02_001180 [Eretmocerus hayati]
MQNQIIGVIIYTCPEACHCNLPKLVDCSGRGLQSLPENVSDLVEHLDLSGNDLTELPTSVNYLTELQHLNLSHNRLTSLPNYLLGLNKLRLIDLTDNEIRNVSRELGALSQLQQLKTLILSHNHLNDLTGLKSVPLHILFADFCGIRILKNSSIAGLPELTHLSLIGNQLKEIRDPYGPKLKILDVSRCQLSSLSFRAFQGFPELIDLRLANNPALIYSTGSETLRHSKLRKIDVSSCNLDRPGLHGLPQLNYARLSNNQIRCLPDRIFAKNRELTHLFLDLNYLKSLNRSSFASLEKLQILDLSANGLKEVQSTVFRDNIELQFLNLSDNQLEEFPKLSSSLISLDLSSNLIDHIDSNSLLELPRLYHLNLYKNLIKEMPSALKSSSLKSLILKRNSIKSFDGVSLSYLPELERLDLSGNLLEKAIGPEVFFDNPNLRQLNLHDNRWVCDCMQLHQAYLYLSSLQTNTELLICHSPSNVTGYSWKAACSSQWTNQTLRRAHNRVWGLVLVTILTIIVLSGMLVSIRHTMKLKRQARNRRLELERAEARERFRLLQQRSVRQQEDLRSSEPRIHPLELIGPPSYEEAVSMTRLARSLDALNSTNRDVTSATRMTASSESLRTGKRQRRLQRRKPRSQSEDDLAKREQRREERLRKSKIPEHEKLTKVVRPVVKRKKTDVKKENGSVKINGNSSDDEDSDGTRGLRVVSGEVKKPKSGRILGRKREREAKSGYRPSTDGDS